VLIALMDDEHVHHLPAHAWFTANRRAGWATCPQTENGFVRIVSGASYPGLQASSNDARTILQEFCDSDDHIFWPDSLSLRDDLFDDARLSHRLIADVYLLGLAVVNKGRLVTNDRRIPRSVLGLAGDAALMPLPL
jgi:toxin-antitoxin system PIN domain toxin